MESRQSSVAGNGNGHQSLNGGLRFMHAGASSSHAPPPGTPATTPTVSANGVATNNGFHDLHYPSVLSYLQEEGLPSLRIGSPIIGQRNNAAIGAYGLFNGGGGGGHQQVSLHQSYQNHPPLLSSPATNLTDFANGSSSYTTNNGFHNDQSYFWNLSNLRAQRRQPRLRIEAIEMTQLLPALMIHKRGCILCRNFFEESNEQQMGRILQTVVFTNQLNFIRICNNEFGKKAVKSLIKNLRSRKQMILVACVIGHHVVSLTKCTNGHEVIYFLLTYVPDNFVKKLIFNEMATNCITIATDRLGCCIIQACIEPSIVYNVADLLLCNIIANSLFLSEDPFGNYVVQHVIKLGINEITVAIVTELGGKFVELATNKFGSNVVETCLYKCKEEEAQAIIMELSNSPNLLGVVQDCYGNYVIQSALEIAKLMRGGLFEALVERIDAFSHLLRCHVYGKLVLNRVNALRPLIVTQW